MNRTRTILVAVFALLLVVSALPAAAVSLHSGPYVAEAYGDAGSHYTEMTPVDTTFCILSAVAFKNIDTDGEFPACEVVRGTYVWLLNAYLNENNDHAAYCTALCFNN